MSFRPAVKADAAALAELVNYAGERIPLYLWTKLAKDGQRASHKVAIEGWDTGNEALLLLVKNFS